MALTTNEAFTLQLMAGVEDMGETYQKATRVLQMGLAQSAIDLTARNAKTDERNDNLAIVDTVLDVVKSAATDTPLGDGYFVNEESVARALATRVSLTYHSLSAGRKLFQKRELYLWRPVYASFILGYKPPQSHSARAEGQVLIASRGPGSASEPKFMLERVKHREFYALEATMAHTLSSGAPKELLDETYVPNKRMYVNFSIGTKVKYDSGTQYNKPVLKQPKVRAREDDIQGLRDFYRQHGCVFTYTPDKFMFGNEEMADFNVGHYATRLVTRLDPTGGMAEQIAAKLLTQPARNRT